VAYGSQLTAVVQSWCMGWLQLVGSLKLWVSFAKEPCKRDYILQKRPYSYGHCSDIVMHISSDSKLTGMGWLQLVGSFKLQVSFAEYSLFCRALLQKRPIIWRSLLIVATPYTMPIWRTKYSLFCRALLRKRPIIELTTLHHDYSWPNKISSF